MKPKPYVVTIHYSRPGALKGKPWSIHTQGECILAKGVEVHTAVATVFRGNDKPNPRALLRTRGFVVESARRPGVFVIQKECP